MLRDKECLRGSEMTDPMTLEEKTAACCKHAGIEPEREEKMGLVKPVTCHVCNGTGKKPEQKGDEN